MYSEISRLWCASMDSPVAVWTFAATRSLGNNEPCSGVAATTTVWCVGSAGGASAGVAPAPVDGVSGVGAPAVDSFEFSAARAVVVRRTPSQMPAQMEDQRTR